MNVIDNKHIIYIILLWFDEHKDVSSVDSYTLSRYIEEYLQISDKSETNWKYIYETISSMIYNGYLDGELINIYGNDNSYYIYGVPKKGLSLMQGMSFHK